MCLATSLLLPCVLINISAPIPHFSLSFWHVKVPTALHNRRRMLGVLFFECNHKPAMETTVLFRYTITRESYSICCISILYLPRLLGPKRQTLYSRYCKPHPQFPQLRLAWGDRSPLHRSCTPLSRRATTYRCPPPPHFRLQLRYWTIAARAELT